MKEMISVRSNPYFTQKENEKTLQLDSCLEVVIIHTDGKTYNVNKKGAIFSKSKLDETRMIVSPEMLSSLITELQLHRKKLEVFRQNADKINSLINHLSKENDS
jgi:hypothetical protein